MKQALEATSQFVETELTVGQRYTSAGQQLLEAIEALRTAIQQAEAQQPTTSEPVAWRYQPDDGLKFPGFTQYEAVAVSRGKPGTVLPLFARPAPGVPATSGPVVWNSIQIASWIGSQLMHEPSMFDRSAVCKFVRSLGRHPTLLKHSPSTHSPAAPGVPDDVVRDAERWRTFLATRPSNTHEGIIAAIDAAKDSK